MATIGDVARQAGVSTTLVSRYLNGVKGVSPASKEKIESAIRALQYVPDESARMLVRRRGGAQAGNHTPPAEQVIKHVLPTSIALICEDTDFQLVNALYLGAKHTVWTDEACRGWQILLFMIAPGDVRVQDEDATIDYIRRTCKTVISVTNGADSITSVLHDKLLALSLPTVFFLPDTGEKPLSRNTDALRNLCARLESYSGDAVRRLCAASATGAGMVTEIILPCAFSVDDTEMQETGSRGRALQSHLL